MSRLAKPVTLMFTLFLVIVASAACTMVFPSTQAAPPTPHISARLASGNYRVEFNNPAGLLRSTWTLEVSGGQITGKSEWDCCPGHRTDTMSGRVEGNLIIVERDCTGQGTPGECHQVYIGTMEGDVIKGAMIWASPRSGSRIDGSWQLFLKP